MLGWELIWLALPTKPRGGTEPLSSVIHGEDFTQIPGGSSALH